MWKMVCIDKCERLDNFFQESFLRRGGGGKKTFSPKRCHFEGRRGGFRRFQGPSFFSLEEVTTKRRKNLQPRGTVSDSQDPGILLSGDRQLISIKSKLVNIKCCCNRKSRSFPYWPSAREAELFTLKTKRPHLTFTGSSLETLALLGLVEEPELISRAYTL
ncbi:hypothetical protein VNO77_20207 [Canavalia gladiata]|uniref:Uncharacterized protein n=1 Tax=Canavalia gladiata TaxID=3824 RepID=A0AAN9LU16_CANGL